MILFVGLLLAAHFGPLEEAELALSAGRVEQSEKMIAQLVTDGQTGPRFDRLRAAQALAEGRDEEALRRYGNLAYRPGSIAGDREGAGIAAYRLGKKDDARIWIDQSTSMTGASWRAFNLCGVLADESGRFAAADECYAKAEALAPTRAEVRNNRGWSLLLRGQWTQAEAAFQEALGLDPTDRIARSNLDLARQAQATDLPVRRDGESDVDFGRRLNDAGVMAKAAGQDLRALSAFANSIDIRPSWSAVAARNLEDAQRP